MKKLREQVAQNRGINQLAVEVRNEYFPNNPSEETASDVFTLAAREGNMKALRELIEGSEGCTSQECQTMIDGARYEAFRLASERGDNYILDRLIALTPNGEQRQAMIHADEDYAFKMAARGHLDVVNLLISKITNENERQAMIHAEEDYAFRMAARGGHLDIVNRLIELTTDDDRRRDMIRADGDYAFIWAAAMGHIDIINLLISKMTDENERQEMIHADSDSAFGYVVTEEGHPDIVKLLIEKTTDERMQDMIHMDDDIAFRWAAEKGHIDIVNLLIEKTPSEQRQAMISRVTDPTPDFTRLLAITTPEFGAQNDETDKTKNLKELRTDLIERFGSQGDSVTKANSVIATLLSRDNLERVGQHFTDVSSIRKGNSLSNGSVFLALELSREVTGFNFPIDFPNLSKSDRETALDGLAHFFSKPSAERIQNLGAAPAVSFNGPIR